MLTGEKDSGQIMQSIGLGAKGYIAKPFKPADFLKQLEKLLGQNTVMI
jgi:AmiR/NasT family two-component response regulator